ncbi:hypothetical protein [Candidatus Nanosynbacter lyticus]|uniref:hypothetical protein n=1 Tax=Candidatus Nanosynbacter lyticus TaxID=2093824 RepID=UPI002553A7F2|nr:hypothetical protein [Candidatus Nanosynbacter lyticus]WLD46826.1 hypothetical protein NLML1_0452 [Candidatus Nanosynbacter lyticus]
MTIERESAKNIKENIEYINSLENAINYTFNDDDRSIIRFMILWTAYNRSYNMYSEKHLEPDRFKEYFKSIAGEYVSTNRECIIRDFKSTKPEERLSVKNMKNEKKKYLRNEEDLDLENLADIIYTIRCNLFHGDKRLSELSEKKIVGWAYELLLNIAKERYGI